MIEYPTQIKTERYIYKLVNTYPFLALYINQFGRKECFTPHDLGLEVKDGNKSRD